MNEMKTSIFVFKARLEVQKNCQTSKLNLISKMNTKFYKDEAENIVQLNKGERALAVFLKLV